MEEKNENKPAAFRWLDKRLSNISYGRGMPSDSSRTVPKAKQEKWDKPVGIDTTKQEIAKQDQPKEQMVKAEGVEAQYAGRKMDERAAQERGAERKNVLASGRSTIENPITKLESHKNINKVVLASEIGAMGGNKEDFDRIGVTEQVIGRNASKIKPTKKDRTESYLDPRGGPAAGKAGEHDKIK